MKLRTLVAVLASASVLLSCSDAPETVEPGMVHIHGLGINPTDGSLYSATHYGLFRITADEKPQRVGELVQDFMGFTVVGPDHFLASGHPGADSHQQSPHLGLIESTDGGRSWNTLSLNGSADFHALEYRHGNVYGHDSQSNRVLISTDRKIWSQRATERAVDVAVSPRDADEVMITTRQGVRRSRDRAATFEAVPGAPMLAYLSWPDSGELVGVDPAGTLYVSADDGTTWQPRHALDQKPQALLAAGSGRVFIATDTMIYQSSDNAVTVEPLASLAD